MAKKRRGQGGRVTPRGTQPKGQRRHQPKGESSLVDDAAQLLRDRSPFGLLALASSLIEATAERPAYRWQGRPPSEMSGPELFETFVDAGLGPTEAVAMAVAAIHPDELLARRLKDRIRARSSSIRHRPPWLDTMGDIEMTDVYEMVHVLADGDNIMIAWRWPDGTAATAVMYIDHNMGTIVKDAFVVDEPYAELVASYHRVGLEDQEIRPLDPAKARARAFEAISRGEITVPPMETDTWPVCRPMIEWVLRQLPAGGEGYVWPDWPEEQREQLLADFVQSPFAAALDLPTSAVRELADPLLWFGCDYGPGDPLRWSPVSVEIVLASWYPRKVFSIEAPLMGRLPDVLGAFIRFAHDRQDIPAYLTDETLLAVRHWTPEFLDASGRTGRSPQSNAARLARIAAGFDPDEFEDDEFDLNSPELDIDDDYFDDYDYDDDGFEDIAALDDPLIMRVMFDSLEQQLIAILGGQQAYEALNNEPLADRAFDWSGVPEQWKEPTAATLARLDQITTEYCDDETRTIGRSILAALVTGDPGLFKRSLDSDRLALGIVWYLADRLDVRRGTTAFSFRTQKELSVISGVPASAISSRSKTVGNTLDRVAFNWTQVIHSSVRGQMLETKQLLADWRHEHPEDH